MAETDAKRTKISELLEYIESRLEELEEEKEELKEFQEKDKERRCLEYALYQRELLDVGEALEELEEERKSEVHGANLRREKWNEREKEVQVSLYNSFVYNWLEVTLRISKEPSPKRNTISKPCLWLARTFNQN